MSVLFGFAVAVFIWSMVDMLFLIVRAIMTKKGGSSWSKVIAAVSGGYIAWYLVS